jgi:hypothetical protein
MVFGHQLRSIVPAHRSAYATCWKSVKGTRDRKGAINSDSKTRYDLRSRDLKPLPIGTNVRVQDPKSKLWSHLGVVVAIGRYQAYRVKFVSGSVLWRNTLTDGSEVKDGSPPPTRKSPARKSQARAPANESHPRADLPTPRRSGTVELRKKLSPFNSIPIFLSVCFVSMFSSGKCVRGIFFSRPPFRIILWFRFFCVEAVTTYLGILCYGVTVWGKLFCQCAPLLVTARCHALEP